MPSDERQEHILIEGDCCVELDYGQMSLAILYGLTGTKPPEGDLYDLSTQGIPTESRPGIKKVIQAIINSPEASHDDCPRVSRKHFPSRVQPQGYPQSSGEEAPHDLPADDLRALVCSCSVRSRIFL